MKKVKDHYFQKAKKEGYVARSVYKLKEIDQKHRLLKAGDRILDLGCAPGSWLQYSLKRIGSKGTAIGIDLSPVTQAFPSNTTIICADVFEELPDELIKQSFDVILSDMAPKTTGIRTVDAQRSYNLCERVMFLANLYLESKGSLLVKIFQGEPFEKLKKEFQHQYQQVKICKPKSSRQESVEIFLLGQYKKPEK